VLVACTKAARPDASAMGATVEPSAAVPSAAVPSAAVPSAAVPTAAAPTADAGETGPSGAWTPPAADGPHEIVLEAGRPIFYAFPRTSERPHRLVAHLHGMCGPPSYACGKWLGAGVDVGVMVCPTGNARCGDSWIGPPSWEASSWPELASLMDRDLEASIAKVEAKHRGALRRDGAVLTGYSRGGYAAAAIAQRHRDRWPYLILIEADASLPSAPLKRAGVRAVALVAGEQGDQIAGMRKTASALADAGLPARLFVMKKTGHLYGEDMELVMHEALSFVLSK
jgi:pimeloyl-ACP methyl ester carboxylesterase